MADINTWDPVDDGNTQPPPAGWPEFMQPSAVNNTARGMMGAIRRWYDIVTAQLSGITTTVNAKVNRSGDTLSGNLALDPVDGNPSFVLDKSAGGYAQLIGSVGGLARWILRLGGSGETGAGNVGSNFELHRYADDGAYLGAVMVASRVSGEVTFSGPVTSNAGATIAGHLTRKDYVDAVGTNTYNAAWTNITTWAAGQDQAYYSAAITHANSLDSNQKVYIDNLHNAQQADITYLQNLHTTQQTDINNRVAKGGDTMTGGLSVPYITSLYGGTLATYANGNMLRFRWDGTNLEYRVDETITKMICDSRNWFNVGVEVGGGGPTNWVLAGLGGATWFYCHVDILSDERIKSNITDSEIDALGLLGRVKLSQFDVKPEAVAWCQSVDRTPEERAQMMQSAQAAHVGIGFVAQQVSEVIPEAVFCAHQRGVAPDGPLPDDLQSINSQMFIPYLVRAVQQLSARIAVLEGGTP